MKLGDEDSVGRRKVADRMNGVAEDIYERLGYKGVVIVFVMLLLLVFGLMSRV